MNENARKAAIARAQALIDGKNVVWLKVETTGLSWNDEVIEIAIVDAATGNPLVNSLVRPTASISPKATAIHGLTDEMVQDAPAIPSLKLEALLDGKTVIVYGGDFAERLIQQSYAAHGLDFDPACTWICAMQLYGQYEGIMSAYGDGWKWWKFDDALDNLHINNEKRNHRAFEEARTIGLLVYEIAHRGDAQTVTRNDLPDPADTFEAFGLDEFGFDE